jgi:ribonuclease P protein component
MQRLKNRAQFQAVLAGSTVARSGHFVLHRLQLPVCAPKALSPCQSTLTTSGDRPDAPVDAPTVPGRFSVPLFNSAGNWLGAMVPKRWAKRAVTRNMIKRRIYSLGEFASNGATAVKADAAYVVRLRSAFDPHLFKSATSQPLRLAVGKELSSLFAQGFQHD